MQNKNNSNIIKLKSLIDDLVSMYNASEFNFDIFYTKFTDLYNEFKPLYIKTNTDNMLVNEDTINSYRIKICKICQDFIDKDTKALETVKQELRNGREQLMKWDEVLNNMDPDDPNYKAYDANRSKCDKYVKRREKLIEGYKKRIELINNYLNGFTEIINDKEEINPGLNNEIKTQIYKYPGYDHVKMQRIERIITALNNTSDFKKFEELEQDLCELLNAPNAKIPKMHMTIIVNAMDYNSDLLEVELLKAINELKNYKSQDEAIK